MTARTEKKDIECVHTIIYEKAFLDGIGTYLDKENENKVPRKEALTRHIKAAEKRHNWMGISKSQVISYAYELLSRESLN
ncbi:hypothetical protein [uncultured Paraglaciecola sp.]|mgnify:CR=1 FL=1|uniref:hypothetical protein n=1 Tax=uncultured Paraglaciecola sp. TaxID=1765024 RepID=UPI0026163A92|nr:hypothetical protein [uncultured Paraglaciecola sp.]